MKIVLYLGIIVALIFLIPPYADAVTITATPRAAHFGPNDWLYIDLKIDGYVGGTMNWIAYRPDNSTFSGSLDQFVSGKRTHLITRNAFDNYFGNWAINYTYNGVTQFASFVVDPIILSMKLDKALYYDGDTMKINITSSYYLPDATKAEYYHLNFYNNKGKLAEGIQQVNIKAHQPTTMYDFLIDDLVRDNPLGKYKVKVQYYNVFVEAPFEVGDIKERMTIFVGTDKSIYNVGNSVDLNLIFSKVKESEGIIEITYPSGNTTTHTFPVTSVAIKLHLEKVAATPGTYRLSIHYAGATQTGSFIVESTTSTKIEPNIVLELSLDKQKYRPGEIINAEIHTTSLIANSLSFWFEDPTGKQGSRVVIPITSGDTIIPHKINKDDTQGPWKMNIDYGGATRYAFFFVEGEPVDSTNIAITNIAVPKLLLTLGFGTDLKFKNPRGIAIDSEDNVYVVDSGNSQIKKFDSTGKFLLSWGSSGIGHGQFKNPSGIFADQKYIYVADTGNARIQKFDRDGNFVYSWGAFGDEPGMFRTPVALAASKLGNLFVSDSGQNKILVFDSNGQYKDEIRSLLTVAAKFPSTNYITFDSKNNFYIVVSDDNRVLQFSDIGTFIKSFGTSGEREGQFNKPSSIAIDSRGNLYVTDTDNHRIQKFDSDGKFLASWGSLGSGPVQFKEPFGMAVDSKNNVYVVDRANNNVQKFAPYSALGEIAIPEWVRNTAKWWAKGAILDSDFVTGIQYMIKQKIINIPKGESITTGSNVTIPSWVKINAGWWSDKKISDKDFATGIQYLVSRGIIKV
ncbi:MAG: 6-bladed beta-propeller [Nitrososphaerota archaeon]